MIESMHFSAVSQHPNRREPLVAVTSRSCVDLMQHCFCPNTLPMGIYSGDFVNTSAVFFDIKVLCGFDAALFLPQHAPDGNLFRGLCKYVCSFFLAQGPLYSEIIRV